MNEAQVPLSLHRHNNNNDASLTSSVLVYAATLSAFSPCARYHHWALVEHRLLHTHCRKQQCNSETDNVDTLTAGNNSVTVKLTTLTRMNTHSRVLTNDRNEYTLPCVN